MAAWYVRSTGFKSQLSPDDKALFTRVCPDRTFAAGDLLFSAGEQAEHLHVIANGQVKMVAVTADGRERIVAICGEDDFIGEAFLKDAEVYRFDAVALTAVTTCPMSRDQYREVVRESPDFALRFTEMLAARVFDCRGQLAASHHPIMARVIRVLLEQAERFGVAEEPDGPWYHLNTAVRHEDIASLVSATRVSITSTMTELRNLGILQGSRGSYRLHLQGLRDQLEWEEADLND
jgi:CRP-like cAMP-binding protein